MNEDQLKRLLNQELAKFLGRMDKTDERLTKLEDLAMKLYQHMEERFDTLATNMADRQQVARLQNSLDGIAKRLETDEQERAAITSQLNRHQNWIIRATDKLQIGYDEAA